ncbi:hypothetical protein ACO0RG_000403 [Hanseniaspora osmophila]
MSASTEQYLPSSDETTLIDVMQSQVLRASIVASLITQTLSHPFEYVKTGQQLSVGKQMYRMFDNKATLFFAGLASANISILGTNIIKFYTYPLTVNYLGKKTTEQGKSNSDHNQNLVATTAGVITGFFEGLLMVPFENIKNKQIYNAQICTEREQKALKIGKAEKDIRIQEDDAKSLKSQKDHAKRTPLNKAAKVAQEIEEISKTTPKQISYEDIAKENKEIALRVKNWKSKADYYYKHPSVKFYKILPEIWQVSSYRGFAQASYLTVFQHMTMVAIQFTALNTFLQMKKNSSNALFRLGEQYEVVQFMLPMVYGVATSAATVLITQPLDVVKTRMQSTKFAPFQTWIRDVPGRVTYPNTFSCFHQTFVEQNGMKAFYKGWMPRLFRLSVLNSGIGFGFYFHFQTAWENYLNGEPQEKPLES